MQCPAGVNWKFKTFRWLKTKFKANTAAQGNAYITDRFKLILGLTICGELKSPKPLECYGPDMWNVKQRVNEMD